MSHCLAVCINLIKTTLDEAELYESANIDKVENCKPLIEMEFEPFFERARRAESGVGA
ncbi:hypothetical protein M7I_1704 [Glarea lozoyensis 74030]|uniref:Uncharacterized protein n=1 Tax=Glarea lozoyensis (strain ATCC 74030 / MF5533) TaxID=1104152 RepID=H0EGT4_GLAL7|nr:hypothetical protein M7I_1704 [Glarea lozoyensis 74030]